MFRRSSPPLGRLPNLGSGKVPDTVESEAKEPPPIRSTALPGAHFTDRESPPLETPREPPPDNAAAEAPGAEDSRRLVVGPQIALNGEIRACDTLVVEGRVDADLRECEALEITPSGRFKGSAAVDYCDLNGAFEGELTVRKLLLLRAGGRMTGTLRYGEIEIERGGKIIGQADSLENAAATAVAQAKTGGAPANTPHEQAGDEQAG